MLGELAAAWYDPNGTKPRADTEAFAAAVAGLGGVLAGDESGTSVNIAAQAGRNAAANNFLNHAEASRRLKLRTDLQACADETCRSNLQGEIDRLNRLDSWRDEQIEQACKSPASDACRGWSAALNVAAQSYHGQVGNLVDLAERSSVQQQAYKYQQAANNPFMHGVGKGLLKLSPPGLLVGAVGGVAMTVQAVIENGLSETLIESANAIANLPADLNARLNSPDPTVRGEALVDLLALGTGTAALSAGGTKVALSAAQQAQLRQAVLKAEQQALAKARVGNNLTADMPGYSTHAVRDFKPGTTHRAEVVNAGQVTDRDGLPRVDDPAKENNLQVEAMIGGSPEWWATQRPAWKEGTLVTDRVTTQMETYRMVVDEEKYRQITNAISDGFPEDAAKHLGSWATKEQIRTTADVRNKLAISSEWKGQGNEPMYVVEFTVKPGVGVREGTVGPMHDPIVGRTLLGGGHQVQFLWNAPQSASEKFMINLPASRRVEQ